MIDRVLLVGDVHYTSKQPVGRVDNYGEAILLKLTEISTLCKKHKVDAVIFAGDIMHTPEIPNIDFIQLVNAFLLFECRVIIVPGNHDIYGYNIETLKRSDLEILRLCVPQIEIICEGKEVVLRNTVITGTAYGKDVDVNGYGYTPYKEYDNKYNIHVVHGMLIPNVPVFEKYTLIKDVKTTSDLIFAGHYHTGWPQQQVGKTTFINNGAICRRDATKPEMERDIVVTLVEVEDKAVIKTIPLKTAKSGAEVLSNQHLVEDKELKEKLDEFNTILKQNKLEKEFVNLDDLILKVARSKSLPEDVIKATLDRLNEVRLTMVQK